MDVLDAIRQRRSVNFFDTGRPVSEEEINSLLALSALAPSSFNLQPWKVVVVTGPERKKALRGCAMDQPKAEEAPAVLIIIADPDSVEENAEKVLESWVELGYITGEQKKTYGGMMHALYGEKDSFKRILFAVKNASLYAMNLMLAAKGMGFETHPMDGFDEECVKKEFGIPENNRIPMLIALGHLRPGARVLPRAYRKEEDDYVGYEYYQTKK